LLTRLIFFVTLACLVYYIVKTLWTARRRSNGKFLRPAEDMVLDPQCHSYLPKSDALVRDGQYFCSESCARAFLSR
jgi:hypothetical protein